MPQIIEYMNYTVYLTSQVDYSAALTLFGGTLINKAPRALAGMLGIPYPYPSGDLQTIDKTITFGFPYSPGLEFRVTGNATGIFVDDTIDFQIVPAVAGNPPSIWPASSDIKFIWTACIVKANGDAETAPSPATAISQRRWARGFEWLYFNEGGSGPNANQISRDSSRTVEGKGYLTHGISASYYTSYVKEYRTGLVTSTSWERIYVRFRTLPVLHPAGIIYFKGGGFGGIPGFGLKWNPDGTVEGFDSSTSTGIVFTPILDTWYKFDFFIKFATGVGTDGRVKLFINSTETYNYVTGGGGLNQQSNHEWSAIGEWGNLIGDDHDTEVEIDFDDWINADLPTCVDPTTLAWININSPADYPIDWLLGSHVRAHYSKSGSFVNWTLGNIGILNQGETGNVYATTSTTSGATLEGLIDVLTQDIQDTLAPTLGVASVTIGLRSACALSTDGKLGYRVAGGAAVLTTIDELAGALTTHSVMYAPSGMILPAEISPFSVVHTKSVDANLNYVSSIAVAVEYLGIWGPEDDPTFLNISRLSNLHNCHYPNTPWAYFGATSAAPVFIVSGTYVGNDGYNPIQLSAPVHFLWIRNTSAANGGLKWFAASIGAHQGGKLTSGTYLRVWTELDGTAWFSVAGNGADSNANGITYQYIAFCDPGGRFNLCGAYAHGWNSVSPRANLLIDPLFTPESGFVGIQIIDSWNNSQGIFYKGPGIPADKMSGMGSGNGDGMNFAEGVLNTLSGLHTIYGSNHYSLWRSSEPGCAGVMVQICNYTGDGAANRNISLTPTSGRFPCFVLVVANSNDGAYFRDPSHVGDNSSNADTGSIEHSGIKAISNPDEITVGVTLNTNGIGYSIFAFPGSDIGMLNGIYYNPICETPISYHIVPTDFNGDIVVIGDGGIDLGGSPLSPTDIMMAQDLSGIYTIVPGQTHDILQDRLVGQPTLNSKIPNPNFKTGYIGG